MKGVNTCLGVFFALLGIAALVLGVANYYQEKALAARAIQHTATLTQYVRDPNYGTADFCPYYEYTDDQGQTYNYIGDECVSKPDESTIGQQSTILVDPDNPRSVVTP